MNKPPTLEQLMVLELAVEQLTLLYMTTGGPPYVFCFLPPYELRSGVKAPKWIARSKDPRSLERFALFGWCATHTVPDTEGMVQSIDEGGPIPSPQMIGTLFALGWIDAAWDSDGCCWTATITQRGMEMLRAL